ncbi:MAG: bifunctional phosphoglucose/phosphomannose isomerase [Saprospiraceae bacterium]|nr:bifunctional phosphoglucose/phosphomannose isomerase [Saprospiraceae bacterium]MBP9209580.1 bifunctional phosphoglucose/phosphomannose isomerase [Saprospiraceae bacterium]
MNADMLEMIRAFPEQVLEAIGIGRKAAITPADPETSHVMVCGMGGSAIAADFVAGFVRDHCRVPVLVNKRYDLPACVDQRSIAVLSSYSGNTEETLEAWERAGRAGARRIALSSAGELLRRAESNGLETVVLPSGWPSPRACLGYSLVLQLFILLKLGLIDDFFIEILETTVQQLSGSREEIESAASHLADLLQHQRIVLYAPDHLEPACLRFRQQLNENAKMLCWHHVIPEMNHNELVGWRDQQAGLAALFLRDREELPRIKARMELTREVVGHYAASSLEVYARGTSHLEKSIYLVHLLDYTSYYLAKLRGVDPVEVRVIDFLKAELLKEG